MVLVEQNELGHGVTGKSTGKLNYLQDSLYDKIKKNFYVIANKWSQQYMLKRKYVDIFIAKLNLKNCTCSVIKRYKGGSIQKVNILSNNNL